MEGANDRYIYLLAVDVKHSALVMPIQGDHRHALMAWELVSCVSVLHVGNPLGNLPLPLIDHRIPQAYHHKTLTTALPRHLPILHSSIITIEVHPRCPW
jgi:hypothetical protein